MTSELQPGTYRAMAPKPGEILIFEGSKILEAQTKEREGDYGRIPVILNPRNTSLLGLRPELRWVQVRGAIEYVLALSGASPFKEITVDAAEVTCVDHPLAAPNRICSLPWPVTCCQRTIWNEPAIKLPAALLRRRNARRRHGIHL